MSDRILFTDETKAILGTALAVVTDARRQRESRLDYFSLEALTQDIEFLLARIDTVVVDISDE